MQKRMNGVQAKQTVPFDVELAEDFGEGEVMQTMRSQSIQCHIVWAEKDSEKNQDLKTSLSSRQMVDEHIQEECHRREKRGKGGRRLRQYRK